MSGYPILFRLIYSLAFYLIVPFVLLRLLYRSLREPGYRESVTERFGGFRSAHRGDVIWIHAVSAGETVAAVPLIRRLLDLGHPCLVTNMTPTGRDRVRELLGDLVENCYAPYDLPGAVNRFLENNRPKLMLTIDTELWPNVVHYCHTRGVPTILVNGRLSAKSAGGYARLSGLTRPMLQSLDKLLVQTGTHAKRFEELGVSADKIKVAGSIKFDAQQRDDLQGRIAAARRLTSDRPVLFAASTHEGEESALLNCLSGLQDVVPDALMVLAPRHTHRVDRVIELCAETGVEPVRLTTDVAPASEDPVLLIDTMGQLDAFFPIATVAFIGGSLVPVGGHNLLEAVVADTPVIMGPYLRNIDDIAGQFIDVGGMRVVRNETDLSRVVCELMSDTPARQRMAAKAREVFNKNQGSLDRVMQSIETFL